MTEYWRRVRTFDPDLWRLLLAAGLTLFVWLGLVAVLYNLYLLRLGFDVGAIGLLVGIGSLVWGLAALPAGLVSNRIGLRNSIVFGISLYGLGIALTLLVETLPRAYWQSWLLGSQVVMNLGIAFATVNVPPYIMAVSKEHERPYAFAILAALNPLAALTGSVLGGLLPGLLIALLPALAAADQAAALDAPMPFRLALWLAPLLCALAIVPLLRAGSGQVAPDLDAGRTLPATRPGAPVALLAFWALVVFLVAIGEGAIRTFFNVLLDTQFGALPATIGLMMGMAQFLPIVVGLALPALLIRWGPGYTLVSGALALATCLLPFALGGAQVGHGPQPPGAIVLWTLGLAYIAAIATLSLIRGGRNMFGQELVAAHWRTSSQGAAMLGLACGLAAASIVGGRIITTYGFGTLYALGALLTLLGACLLGGYLHRLARRRSPPGIIHQV